MSKEASRSGNRKSTDDHLVYKFHRVTRNKNQIVKGKEQKGFFTNGVNGLVRSLLGTQGGREIANPRGRTREVILLLYFKKKRDLDMFLGLCISGGKETGFRESMEIIDRALENRMTHGYREYIQILF